MLEEFALLASLFSIVIAIFAIIIILLLKKNVTDILNKDVILFDKNFDIKKRAIDKSFEVLDELNRAGSSIIKNAEFKSKAVACYNELLCVIGNIKIVDEFYSLAISGEKSLDDNVIARYKLDCRKDIGFRIKGSATLNEINLAEKKKAKTKNLSKKGQDNKVKTISEQPKNIEPTKNEQAEKPITANNANPAQVQNTNIRPNTPMPNNVQPNIPKPNINPTQTNTQPNPTIVRPTQNANPTTNLNSKPLSSPTQNAPSQNNENIESEEKHRGRPRKN